MTIRSRVLAPVLMALPALVSAADTVPLGDTGSEFTYRRLVGIANGLAQILLEIAGIAAVGAIVWYGLQMAMARDNANKFNEAKKGLWLAILGSLVIFGALTIVATIQSGVKSVGGN